MVRFIPCTLESTSFLEFFIWKLLNTLAMILSEHNFQPQKVLGTLDIETFQLKTNLSRTPTSLIILEGDPWVATNCFESGEATGKEESRLGCGAWCFMERRYLRKLWNHPPLSRRCEEGEYDLKI